MATSRREDSASTKEREALAGRIERRRAATSPEQYASLVDALADLLIAARDADLARKRQGSPAQQDVVPRGEGSGA